MACTTPKFHNLCPSYIMIKYCLFCKMGMDIDPDYGEVFFNYGNLLSDVGEYEKAVPMYVPPPPISDDVMMM